MRLYEPTKGEILLNGKNIQKFTLLEYYMLFSTMFQHVQAYAFSIAENVAMSTEVNADMLLDSLMHSGLHDVVQRLPKKENTQLLKLVDDSGIEFSGGEMQKLAFARAIYKNAPIVLLDEPTASLDAKAENLLYEKYEEFSDGKMSFFVSHRLASCIFCDDILVFDQGRIVQTGNHQTLMKDSGGLYAQMFTLQAQHYKNS